MKKLSLFICFCIIALCAFSPSENSSAAPIKWVDCNVSYEVLSAIAKLDIKYNQTNVDFKFCEAIAYLATKNGNKFSAKIDAKNVDELVKKVEGGTKIGEIYGDNKYYNYYVQAYTAIFSEFIGQYGGGEQCKYGVKVFFPLAKGHWYSHYDDFGADRSYGFKRKHLGHDIMGSVGTPVVAIEGGTVAELGWNIYGGWRIGIRSHDKKRYYYYAHLRKDKPFAPNIEIGSHIKSGQLIGYLGNTGYSTHENDNLKTGKPHLHIGMQIIFDESVAKNNYEIWIDMYQITRFLSAYRTIVPKL